MKISQILLAIAVILMPVQALALSRDIHIEWAYPYYTGNIAGFRLYLDNAAICETNDPNALAMDCTIEAADGPANFTLNTFLPDGSEGSPSPPVTFIFSSSLKAMAAADTLQGESPLSVNFDASGSTGNVLLYEWTFGDGEIGTGMTISHIFAFAGNYSVTLKATDTLGATDQDTLSITVTDPVLPNAPPTAVISSSSTVGTAPLPVQFDGSGSYDSDGTIHAYNWEMGDGGLYSGPLVDHIYTFAGLFNAMLTVTDNGGLQDSVSTPVIVSSPVGNGNIAPNAVITTSNNGGPAPLTVTFRADKSNDPDGEIVAYSWNFGDGSTSSNPQATHTFTEPAVYTVTLKVTDNKGEMSQAARVNINVLPAGEKGKPVPANVRKAMPFIINLLLKSQQNNTNSNQSN